MEPYTDTNNLLRLRSSCTALELHACHGTSVVAIQGGALTVALYLRKNRAYVFNDTTLRLTSHTRRRRRSTHDYTVHETSDHTRDAHPRHTTQWNRTHETRHTVTM